MPEIRLLGDIAFHDDDGPRDLGHRRQKTVFALLVVHSGTTVSTPWLVEQIWGSRPPQRARDTLYSYLSRLRKILSAVDGMELRRDSGGYRLIADAGNVDMYRFRELTERAATLPDAAAIPLWETALGLWNGEPFADVAAAELTGLRETLTEEHFAAELDLGDALLRTGQHVQLLPILHDRTREHPLDERLAEQYLLALHRNGQTEAALEHFESLRAKLTAERGTDPGPAIRRLYDRIRDGGDTTRSTPTLVPRQLPGHATAFVGREAALARLDALVGTAAVAVITGTAGVGKTTLAVHWAHQAAAVFPDGQLYVNMRGYDPSGEPLAPEDAIRGFLDGFGIPRQHVPADFEAQTDMYQRLLTGRKVLVVFDNVSHFDQVRPFLPEGGDSMALVTSRRPWDSPHTPTWIALDVLSRAEAGALLARRIGSRLVDAGPATADELVELCARLPLALSIVAARTTLRPGHPLESIVAEIRDRDAGLSVLDSGEAATSPRSVFDWSYRALSPEAAALFRALSVKPGPDVSVTAAASLSGRTVDQACALLSELRQTGLLSETRPGRFAFHDLLRTYSRELGATHDPPRARAAILQRLLGWSVHSADAASAVVNETRERSVTGEPPPDVIAAEFSDPDASWAWFDAEYTGLLDTVKLAVDHGHHREVIDLEWTITSYLAYRALSHSAMFVHKAAISAARHLGDKPRQARSLRNLARALATLRQFEPARERLLEALSLVEEATDLREQAHTHLSLGGLYNRQDRHAEALPHARRALALHREIGNYFGIAKTLNNIGWLNAHLGDFQAGLAHCREALDMYTRRDQPSNRAEVLDSLGYIHTRLGDHANAVGCLEEAVAIFRQLGHRYSTADSLTHLGGTYESAGDVNAARAAYHEALSILEDTGHPDASSVREKLRLLG